MSITSRINEMSSHIGNAYDELQGLGADLTNVNKNIENISIVLDDIYDSMPQVSGEGTSLTLDDTRVGKIKSTLKGNTSQSGTPTPTSPIPINVVSGDNEISVVGKNLLSFANYTNISGTSSHGVTRTFDGETIILNGTTTSAGNIVGKSSTGIILKAGTYTGSITTSGSYNRPSGDVAFYLRKNNTASGMLSLSLATMTTDRQYSSSFILTEDTEIFLEIYTNASNITFNNYICKFQIENGFSATDFVQYQGNTYNIDLPVENSFDISAISESTFINTNGATGTSTSTNLSGYTKVVPSATYTLSYTYTTLANPITRSYCWYDESKVLISGDIYTPANAPITLTVPNNARYIRFGYDKNCTNIKLKQDGTTPIELCKIGNYQDYFYKDNGKWYLHKEIGKVVLNGSENYQLSKNTTPYVFTRYVDNYKYVNENILYCNYFTSTSNGTYGSMTDGETHFRYYTDGNFALYFCTADYSNTTDFKEWITNHNIIVYYVLATPVNTALEDM